LICITLEWDIHIMKKSNNGFSRINKD